MLKFPTKMNLLDARHYYLSRCLNLNMTLGIVGVVDGQPEIESITDTLTAAQCSIPRLRQNSRESIWNLTRPKWRDAGSFRTVDHLRELHLFTGALPEAVMAADELQGKRFDENRPLWDMRVVRGLDCDRAMWIFRIHHSMADGVAAFTMLQHMFGQSIDQQPAARASRQNCQDRLDHRGTRLGLTDILREVDDFIRPGLVDRRKTQSVNRRASYFTVPRNVWRARARSAGGSSNDLYLALVAHWLRLTGIAGEGAVYRVVMPVNIRNDQDMQVCGNVTGGGVLFLDGAMRHLDDLSEINQASQEAQTLAHRSPPSDAALDYLPGAIHARAIRRRFSKTDVVATKMVMTEPLQVGGRTTSELFAQAPPIGAPAAVALVSYIDKVCLTVNFDTGIVPETTAARRALRRLLEDVFGSDEVRHVSSY